MAEVRMMLGQAIVDWNFWLTLVAIIVSILALVYSIRVPERIAKNQDKIALLEKRIETYIALDGVFQQRSKYSFAIGSRVFYKEQLQDYKLNPFVRENMHVVFTVRALFPSVKVKLEELMEIYKQIKRMDEQISDALDYLMGADDERRKRIFKLFGDYYEMPENEIPRKELKEISNSFYIEFTDSVMNECKDIPCNIFDLQQEQERIMKKAIELENGILQSLEEELSIG